MENNSNIKKIQRLLDDYIERSSRLREKYEEKITLKAMYDELLILLNGDYDEMKENNIMISILFNSIYKNDIYEIEYYRVLNRLQLDKSKKSEINKFINVIRNDAKKIEEDISSIEKRRLNSRSMVSSAMRVRLNLRQGSPILEGKYDIYNVKKIINYYQLMGVINNKEELLLINEIELYNRKLMSNNSDNTKENLYTEELYEKIPNILQAGYQENDVIVIDDSRKDTIDKLKKEIIDSLDSINTDDMIEFISGYKKYNITNDEYNYIIIGLMDRYLSDMLVYYDLLTDKEVYHDRRQRREAVKDYYKILDKYLYLREYYEKINEEEIEEVNDEVTEQEIIQDNGEVKELIYSRSVVNPLKALLIADMDDVPFEYYDTVYDLIDRFINNKLTIKEIKTLTSKNKKSGVMELLHDQVRIVFKHVRDNIYCMLGVFAKKATNNVMMYNKLTNRMVPDISTVDNYNKERELSEYNTKELEELVSSKGRKGTR